MDDSTNLIQQADKVRASGIMGQSRLLRLFDFLVERSAAGAAPKEVVIARDVFNKSAAFDGSIDASVRVYIYNLRRKLTEFYSKQGKREPLRLTLPKGEYRFVVVPAEPASISDGFATESPSRRRTLLAAALGIGLLIGLVVTGLTVRRPAQSEWDLVRHSTPWKELLANGKPTVIVFGDYYIFGDTEVSQDVQRLIRNFSINSKDDLRQYLQTNPDLTDRYLDVGLSYLPTSSAFALANIMPILATAPRHRNTVAMLSMLDPEMIKSANIIYIGLLSGLGSLQRLALAGSRFQLGESFDELIDRKTQHHYFSGALHYAGETKHFGTEVGYHDYGYFSTFPGLAGNQILIIAGTQDEGLRQMVDALSDGAKLEEMNRHAGGATNYEALIEVLGMNSLNLSGKLLITSALNPATIWTAH